MVIDVLGVALAILFILLYRRASHYTCRVGLQDISPVDDRGGRLFMFAFIADYVRLVSGGIPWLELAHIGLLLMSVIVFVATNFYLPQEP